MHPILLKTFGGLSLQYYMRQLIFGLLISGFVIFMLSHGAHGLSVKTIILLIINSVLYPYSRFVYESIVNFIMGDNLFIVNTILLLAFKLMTMAMCWSAAILIAPIGLAYLYYHHSKTNTG